MAFRSFRKGFVGKRRFQRRKSLYETQQLSWCRQALPLGISDCQFPDQFFFPLVSGKAEYTVSASGGAVVPSGPALSAKGVIARGIKFDYCIGYSPPLNDEAGIGTGITSIRCAVILLPVQPSISSGAGVVQPLNPAGNILHQSQTDPNSQFQQEQTSSRYRILWRGMDYMQTITAIAASGQPAGDLFDPAVIAAQLSTPYSAMAHRTVTVKNGAVVDMDHGLFFLIEVINPFLTDNPTLGFDLFGKVGVKPLVRGNRYL